MGNRLVERLARERVERRVTIEIQILLRRARVRRMRRVVGNETEERIILRFVDELQRFVRDDVRRIAGVLLLLAVPIHRRILIAVPARRHRKPVIEALLRLGVVADVPLSAQPDAVTVGGKHFAERGFVSQERVGCFSLVLFTDPIVDPVLRRDLPREKSSAAGRANRRRAKRP